MYALHNKFIDIDDARKIVEKMTKDLLRGVYHRNENWPFVSERVHEIFIYNDLREISGVRSIRRQLLDLLEAYYGQQPQWKFVRRQILKLFGPEGLSSFFNQEEGNGNGKNEDLLSIV